MELTYLINILTQIRPANGRADRTLKLTNLIDTFVQARRADGRAPRTIADYRRVLEPFVEWCGQRDVTMENLDQDAVRHYVASLYDRGWSTGTVGIHVRNLRSFLNWLHRERLIMQSLAQAIRTPASVIREGDLPTEEELLRLLDACRGDKQAKRDRALILSLLDTGLRRGEMVLIQRDHLHPDPAYGTSWMWLYRPKTKSYHFAFLGIEATRAVQAYLDERGDSWSAMWVGIRGPLTVVGIYKAIRRRAVQAGLDPARLHPHAFRKSFATRWTENGGDRIRLKQIGGRFTDEVLERYVLLADRNKLAEGHRCYGPVDRLFKRN
jgi:integrase/recombinase XerC